MSSIDYELKNKFEYAYKGEPVEAQFLAMSPPNSKFVHLLAPLKQAFTLALQDVQEKNKSTSQVDMPETAQTEEDKTPEELKAEKDAEAQSLIMMLEGSKSVDMAKIVLHFREYLKNSNAVVLDGSTSLNSNLIDQLSLDDFYGALGHYLLAFIVASLMS